jgi:hypothetical protein
MSVLQPSVTLFFYPRLKLFSLLLFLLSIVYPASGTQAQTKTPLDKTALSSLILQTVPKRHAADTAGTILLNQESLEIKKDPDDPRAPFDLLIRIKLSPNEQFYGPWASSRLIIKGKPINPTIGGSNQCSELPIPNQQLDPSMPTFDLRLISNNSFGAEFDWRLYPGDYTVKLQLFSENACKASSFFAELEKVILVSP